jgi:D-xylose transport system substrate-binding protein
MTRTTHRLAISAAALLIGSMGLTACGANEAAGGGNDASGEGGGGDAATIALLLPETQNARYETHDRPIFEARVKELCAECEVLYFNADQDEKAQAQQVDSAITQGADVIVLDPVDGEAIGASVADAQSQDIPVVAYDRFIEGADYYMSFDNEQVGRLQGEALVEAMGDQGSILMVNGSPTDPNAAQFKAGAHSVIDDSGLKVLAEYDTVDWEPSNAQQFVTDQVAKLGLDRIQGVYAANDGTAGGAIAALTGAGVSPDALPPVTGQDAELAAVQRIVAGEQTLTIYKSIKTEAEKAAEVAVALARGEEVGDTEDFQGIPSFIFDPVVVDRDNVQLLVDEGFWSVDEICTQQYADACAEIGLS